MENPERSEIPKRQRVGGRSAAKLGAVADAVMAELVESGVADFSVPRVAVRAGVNSSSIYRRWPNKAELIGFAGARWAQTAMPAPDLGSVRKDLLWILENGAKALRDPQGRALMALNFNDRGIALDGHAQSGFWQQRVALYEAVFDRAVSRGEIAANVDREEILERTFGPLHARAYVSRRSVTRAFLKRVVDAALADFGPG